MIDNTPR